MKKNLLILRHAKSSHATPGLADHDRPLNERGRRDAPRVGQVLVDEDLIPDHIFCSTAIRARETLALVLENFAASPAIEYRADLYLAPPAAYVRAIHQLPDEVRTVLVVGHNPGLEAWVETLAEETHTFTTAALAHFKLAIESWTELSVQSTGKLKMLWRPKEAD